MNRLRTKLILAFLAATIVPLFATLWIMTSLLEHSLSFATTEQLDRLSKTLEDTGRQYYQQAREGLRRDAESGAMDHTKFSEATRATWPPNVVDFWESVDADRFALSTPAGDRLDYLVRSSGEVRLYSRPLAGIRMEELSDQYRDARNLVERAKARDLRRGFTATLVILVAAIWLVAFVSLIYLANRMSRPIQRLTAGLSELAAGHLDTRIHLERNDEIGRAIRAFNHTAGELEQGRDRLVYLTQIASWQMLARKMAHELKNSLTPIRLTVEEILARQPEADRPFMEQAVRIVVNEIETLERRVRAFSDFSTEPEVRPVAVDINGVLSERIAFLKAGHPETSYKIDTEANLPPAMADPDHVNGILTNLLENAADAAGATGAVLGRTFLTDGHVCVEIHDSGAGLSKEASRTLFEPTITFKPGGMGLGLSIARKNALLCGGDLVLIDGRMGGAAFRLTLPRA